VIYGNDAILQCGSRVGFTCRHGDGTRQGEPNDRPGL
jgi:hypothetical protein